MLCLLFIFLNILIVTAVNALSDEDVVSELKVLRRIIENQNKITGSMKLELEKQQKMYKTQDLKISFLVKAVDEKDEETRKLKEKLNKQWHRQNELESKVNEMLLTMEAMEREVKASRIRPVPEDFIQGNRINTSSSRPMESKFTKEPQHVRDVKRKGRGSLKSANVGSVAFYAYMSSDMTNVGGHQTLIYDVASLNIGGAYHPISGVFIAPSSGIYVFAWSARVSSGSHFSMELARNGYAVGSIYVHSTEPTSSTAGTTVAIEIEQGDEVFVRTRIDYNNGTIDSNAYGYASFVGWKLN